MLRKDIEYDPRKNIEDVKNFKKLFPKYQKQLTGYIRELQEIADDIDKCHKDVNIANVTGSSAGILGGILTISGLIASPFTLGASLVLSGIGIGVGVAGGVTNIGASVTDIVNQKKKQERVHEIREQYEKASKIMSDSLIQVRFAIESLINYNENEVVVCLFNGVTHTGMKSFGGIAVVVSAVTKNTLRTLKAVSGIMSGLLMVWDIYSIVKDAKDIHRGSKTEVAERIREAAKNIEQEMKQYEKVNEELIKTFEF
ncbi:apolipoprotein L3-like [Heterodontus francisci]|uniref:apolipoprotein L3-like n=1 Tax=Heterodontus francisci TaxID=7792 RepID=UPI00355C5B2A